MKSFLQANQRINRVTDSHVAGFKKAIEDAPGYGGGAFTTPKEHYMPKLKASLQEVLELMKQEKGKVIEK